MRVSAAGNMPLQGLVKPPAKPVVMITFFYLTAEGRRIQRELHMSHIKKLHTYISYVRYESAKNVEKPNAFKI